MNLKKKISTFLLTFLFILSLCAIPVSAAPAKVTNVKIRTVGNTATLSWDKVKNAKGYNIYKQTSSGTFKKIRSITSTSIKFSGLTYNQTYSFKVCAYDSKNTEGTASSVVSCKPVASKPGTPRNFQYTALGDRAVTLKWSRVSGASGYEISKYDKETKSYQAIRTITNPSTVKVYIQKLTDGETYKLAIRSFKSVKGGKVYSNYSDPVTFTASAFSKAVKAVRSP
ncbi:MAG: fibronectin type III domain-containing protein, partial [Muricoprocola sp.]